MFVKNQEKITLVDNCAEAIKVEKDLEAISSCLGDEEDEVLMESDMDRIISQFKDEITNLKRNKGQRKKPFKKKISTNTSLKIPPFPRINLEDYAFDNFCRTHCAYHSEKNCPKFLNSFYALLLPPGTPENKNKDVGEENYEDEEGEAEELNETEHPPNLNLVWDETELDTMDDDVMKEDCVGIDYNLCNKESHSSTITSTPTKTSTEEFLEKDEQNEKDSTPNLMVNDSSNRNKLVMSSNSIINNSFFETFFGRSNVELSSFANSYKQFELLPCNQIAELDCTLVYFSFTNSCTLFTKSKSWSLYFDISRNEYGADVGYHLIDPCGNGTYLVVQLEPGCTGTVVEYETLIQGIRKLSI